MSEITDNELARAIRVLAQDDTPCIVCGAKRVIDGRLHKTVRNHDFVEPREVADNTFKEEGTPFRRFYLWRVEDETGISRTGRVLEGALTQSGEVIVQWRPPLTSIAIYKDFDTFMAVHVTCHPSKNEVRWIDI